MNLAQALVGSTQLSGTPSVQPNNTISAATPFFRLTHINRQPFLENTTDNLMGTSPVGYSEPNPVAISGMPPTQTITGIGQIRVNDAPSGKGGQC